MSRVIFSDRQIELAQRFKAAGISWEPRVGHYVYDAGHAVEPTSPFQDHVYFLLNYDCFMRKVGGLERFKQIMTWLPTWGDARELLEQLGMPSSEVQAELLLRNAIVNGDELTVLYELVAQRLGCSTAAEVS